MLAWRDIIESKYSKLPGVRSLHDFLLLRPHPGKDVIMKVREHCFDPREELKVSSLHVARLMALLNPSSNNPGRVRPITDEKMDNMVQQFRAFEQETSVPTCVCCKHSCFILVKCCWYVFILHKCQEEVQMLYSGM